MPRRINDIDPVLVELLVHAVPETGCSGGGNGNSALLLLLHPIHGGITVMHLTYLVRHTGIKKHTFGGRRLSSIDVSHDADIAIPI